MSLTAQQRSVAQMLYALAAPRVGPARAREFVAAALAESGLNPHARNTSSGAAGLFQLLSGGYRQKAQRLGGLDNPRANALAILPDYVRYWQQHPHAAAGAAGRDVERSGEGAGFYARGLAQVPQFGGGVATASSPVRPGQPPLPRPGLAAAPDTRQSLARVLLEQVGRQPNIMALLAAERVGTPAGSPGSHTPSAHPGPPMPPSIGATKPALHGSIAELLQEGTGGPTHSTGPHVHLATRNAQAMLAALAEGRRLGLSERENPYVDPVDPVHAPHSYHNRRFPGRYNGRPLGQATDFSGARMNELLRWIKQHLR